MAHCPYCGSTIKNNELFCIQCGEKLPADINARLIPTKKYSRSIYVIPIIVFLLSLIGCTSYYFFLKSETKQAITAYQKAESYLLDEQYQKALVATEVALEHNSTFPAAQDLRSFTTFALTTLDNIKQSTKENSYQETFVIINDAKKEVSRYSGEAAIQLADQLDTSQVSIQLENLREKLEDEPSIQALQTLLWEAEGIQDPIAIEMATSIRDRIIAYSSTSANQLIQDNQFSDARTVVENALRYAPKSEKLSSLKTTIEKEKTAFEVAQEQRIELAMTAVEAEREVNKNDAVTLLNVGLEKDAQGNLVVSGKLKSVATVPITSIAIKYTIFNDKDKIIDSNEIYVYPETLYPDEEGKFDHTHFDLIDKNKIFDVKIETITWFVD